MEQLAVRPSAIYSPVISSIIPVSDKTQDVEIISVEADDMTGTDDTIDSDGFKTATNDGLNRNVLIGQAAVDQHNNSDVQINTFGKSANEVRKELASRCCVTTHEAKMHQRSVPTYRCYDENFKEKQEKKDTDLINEMARAAAAAASATVVASEPILQSQRNLEVKLMEMTARINELQSLNAPENTNRIKHLENQLDEMLSKRLNFVEQLQIEHIKSQRKFQRLAKENSAPTSIVYCPTKEPPSTPKKMSRSAQVSKESLLSTPSPRTRAPKPIKLDEIEMLKAASNQNNNSKIAELAKKHDTYHDLKPTREKSSTVARASSIVDKLQNLNDSIKETAYEHQERNPVTLKKTSPLDAYFVQSEYIPSKGDIKVSSYKPCKKLDDIKDKLKNISDRRNRIEHNFETLFIRQKPIIGDLSERNQVSKLVDKNIAKIKPQVDQYVADRLQGDGKKITGKNHLQKNINLVKANKQNVKKKLGKPEKEASKIDKLNTLIQELNKGRNNGSGDADIQMKFNKFTPGSSAIALAPPRKIPNFDMDFQLSTKLYMENNQTVSKDQQREQVDQCLSPIAAKPVESAIDEVSSSEANYSSDSETLTESSEQDESEVSEEVEEAPLNIVGFKRQEEKKSAKKSAIKIEKKSATESPIIAEMRRKEEMQKEKENWIEKEIMVRILSEIQTKRRENEKEKQRLANQYYKKGESSEETVKTLGKPGVRVFLDAGCPVDDSLVRNLTRDIIRDQLRNCFGECKQPANVPDDTRETESLQVQNIPVTPVESLEIGEEKSESYADDFEGIRSEVTTPVSSPRPQIPNFKQTIDIPKTPEITPNASSDEASIQDLEENAPVTVVKNVVRNTQLDSFANNILELNKEKLEHMDENEEKQPDHELFDFGSVITPKSTPPISPRKFMETPSLSESISEIAPDSPVLQPSEKDALIEESNGTDSYEEVLKASVQIQTTLKSEETVSERDRNEKDYEEESEDQSNEEITETIGELVSEGQWVLDKSEGEVVEASLGMSSFPQLDKSLNDMEPEEASRSEGEFLHKEIDIQSEAIMHLMKQQIAFKNLPFIKKLETQQSLGEILAEKKSVEELSEDHFEAETPEKPLEMEEDKENTNDDIPENTSPPRMVTSTPKQVRVEPRRPSLGRIMPTDNLRNRHQGKQRRSFDDETTNSLEFGLKTFTLKQEDSRPPRDSIKIPEVASIITQKPLLNTVEFHSTDEQTPLPPESNSNLHLSDTAKTDPTDSEMPDAMNLEESSATSSPRRLNILEGQELFGTADTTTIGGIRSSLRSTTEQELQFSDTNSTDQLRLYKKTLEGNEDYDDDLLNSGGYEPSTYQPMRSLSPRK
ncbi:DgyrCDS11306 [Dimorphilus gyrociliatus]|uniref:DgyrCDS11306 n=1 Tax=Dimorphilus gyrociliatus TaxID=2664684 RepID=A0A7I8W4S8_9ANNE|nr:DgyrCDS11306 [Dimorphilus gyrociliatus]